MDIVCPSGLKGSVRAMRVKELGLLTDPKMAKVGTLMTKMVDSCWVQTIDPGPYNFPSGTQKLPWGSMLQADRLYTFKQIRIATYGPEYDQDVECPDTTCAKKFTAVVDLSQLEVTPLPASSVAHVREGTPFALNVDSKTIQFRLLRAEDDRKLSIYMREKDIPVTTAGYICRMLEVPGIDTNIVEDLANWFDGLSIEEGMRVMEIMDRAEPAISTRVSVTCPRCTEAFEINVPLILTLFPAQKKKQPGALKPVNVSSTMSSELSGTPSKTVDPLI